MRRSPAVLLLGLIALLGSAACKNEGGLEPREPGKKYAALGDSFVTGEGGKRPEQPGDPCKRNEESYPRMLASDFRTGWELTAFAACSGATTANVRGQQVSMLSDQLDYVTLTIGGNDLGFGKFVQLCVVGDCSQPVWNQPHFDAATSIRQALVDTYRLVLSSAPNAKIYVTNYPQIVAGHCDVLEKSGVAPAEVTTARDLTSRLNGTIVAAIEEIDDKRLALVDVTTDDSPFSGHSLCDAADPFFNAIVPHDLGASFHPNFGGAQAYAAAIREKHTD